MSDKKIVYFGLDLFLNCLCLIHQRGFEIVKIFTSPDDEYDRTEKISSFANENGIPVSYNKPTKEELRELRDNGADLLIIGAYPWRIPIIENMYQVNIHPAVLPIGRGPWPMPVSILRELDSGVTLHRLSDEIDAGDVILQEIIPFSSQDNLVTLTEKIQIVAGRLLDAFLSDTKKLWESAKPQSCGEYWSEPLDCERSFELNDDIRKIDRILKAFYGYGALTRIGGKPVKIIEGEISDTKSDVYPSVAAGQKYLICKKWDCASGEI